MDWPGEKTIVKLLDLIGSGVGGFVAPWQMKRMAKAGANARRIEMLGLEKDRDILDDLRAGRRVLSDDLKLLPSSNAEEVLALPKFEPLTTEVDVSAGADMEPSIGRLMQAKQFADEAERQINIAQIVLKVMDELETGTAQPSDEEVDRDWFMQWRNHAQDISNDDMQRLWAKILAGEVEKPGTFSLRAMNLVRELSDYHSHWIQAVAPYVVYVAEAVLVPRFPQEKMPNELRYMILLELQQLGILSTVEVVGGSSFTARARSLTPDMTGVIFTFGSVALVMEAAEGTEFTMKSYAVTSLGHEILQLAKCEPSEFCIDYVAKFFRETASSISIATYTQEEGDFISLQNVQPLKID